MNATQNDDDHCFRLIDGFAAGDLDLAARRELIAWLDGDPWRWRRCALALSEVRELEQALRDWTAEASKPGVDARAPAQRPDDENTEAAVTASRGAIERLVHVRHTRGERLAMAASILFAFGLGVAVRGTTLDAPRPVVNAKGDAAGDDRRTTTAGNIVASSRGESGLQVAQPAAQGDPSAAKAATVPSAQVSGKPASTADQPAARSNDRNEARLVAANRAASGPIPAYVRSQLERRGYRVDSQQALVPVALPDGRRVMLPVDKLQLSYVGLRSY